MKKSNSSPVKHSAETSPTTQVVKIISRKRKKKIYRCENCPAEFMNPGHLRDHNLTHTGEKPHTCRYCPKKFARKNTLTVHERRHTGDKPFVCQFCPQKFAESGNLRVHERIHTKTKPYKCPFCIEETKRRVTKFNCKQLVSDSQKEESQIEEESKGDQVSSVGQTVSDGLELSHSSEVTTPRYEASESSPDSQNAEEENLESIVSEAISKPPSQGIWFRTKG